MKKNVKLTALLLAVLMLGSALSACGGSDGTTAATVPTGPADYTVKLVDPQGDPVTGVGIKFLKNGEQVGMAMCDDTGVAVKNLERGDYTLQLTFTDVEHTFHYSQEDLVLSATKTETTVVVAYELAGESINVVAGSDRYAAYTLTVAGSSLTVTGLMDSTMDGTYTFTNNDGEITVNNTDIAVFKNLAGEYVFTAASLKSNHDIVDASGAAVKDLADGTYTVMSNEHAAALVETGCTYIKLDRIGRNYFIFAPVAAGIYEFTLLGDGTLGSYNTPHNVYDISDVEVIDSTYSKTVTQDMIGTNGTGTTQWVIGIDVEAVGDCYLCIKKVGEPPAAVEWTYYQSTYTPSKYTLPAGLTIREFDLSAATYNLVYNETDKFYHLNSEDGPIVLVRLLEPNDYTGFAFGNTLLGANIGTYHYDDNGDLVKKILYNDCVQQYLGTISGEGEKKCFTGGMCDDTYGVYPLTKDLETVIKNYGEYMGYWDSTSVGYILSGVIGLNAENAWLFLCCYAE